MQRIGIIILAILLGIVTLAHGQVYDVTERHYVTLSIHFSDQLSTVPEEESFEGTFPRERRFRDYTFGFEGSFNMDIGKSPIFIGLGGRYQKARFNINDTSEEKFGLFVPFTFVWGSDANFESLSTTIAPLVSYSNLRYRGTNSSGLHGGAIVKISYRRNVVKNKLDLIVYGGIEGTTVPNFSGISTDLNLGGGVAFPISKRNVRR